MSARAYVELDIVNGKCDRAVRDARLKPGVVVADQLEDSSKVMVVVEAGDRVSLGDVIMPVLKSLEQITLDMDLRVCRDEYEDKKDAITKRPSNGSWK